MSADNYILIRKEKEKGLFELSRGSKQYGIGQDVLTGRTMTAYVGYEESASAEVPSYSHSIFNVVSLEEAIILAQEKETEYGYRFEGLGANAP